MDENDTKKGTEQEEVAAELMAAKNISKKRIRIFAGITVIIFMLAVITILAAGNSPARKLEKQLALAQKYLTELDYEQAIVAFETAIKIDPKNVKAYLGLAETYVEMGNLEKAKEVLEEGYAQTEDAGIAEKLSEIEQKLLGRDDGHSGEIARPGQDDEKLGTPDEGSNSSDAEVEAKQEEPEEVSAAADGEAGELFRDGMAGNMLKETDVTFLGHAIAKWDYDTVKDMIEGAGYPLEESELSRQGYVFSSDTQQFSFEYGSYSGTEEVDYLSGYMDGWIECCGIRMGDSMETVLEKLGCQNVSAIMEFYQKVLVPVNYEEFDKLFGSEKYAGYYSENDYLIGTLWSLGADQDHLDDFVPGFECLMSQGWEIGFYFWNGKLWKCGITYGTGEMERPEEPIEPEKPKEEEDDNENLLKDEEGFIDLPKIEEPESDDFVDKDSAEIDAEETMPMTQNYVEDWGVLHVVNGELVKVEYYGTTENLSITIPEGVTSISPSAFDLRFRNDLKEVILPDGMEKIEEATFAQCWDLTKVVMPDSITEIGDKAFLSCKKLKDITLSSNLKVIGDAAFDQCDIEYMELPDSVIKIGRLAFFECKKLQQICIPSGVKIIEDLTFFKCYMLQEIVIPDGVETIEEEAFMWCDNLKKVVLPDSVTSLGNRAFYGCTDLTDITLPENVQLGEDVFKNTPYVIE